MKKDNQNIELFPIKKQPLQLSLLQDITNQAINTQSLRVWDSLLNAVFDDRKVVARVADKFLQTETIPIVFNKETIEVIRYPARMNAGNNEKDVFPMKKDSKVLEALLKIAVDNIDTAFYQGEGTHYFVPLTA